MPLTPEQEWTIVACGLIAHADGELSEGECDPVLAAIDERLPEAERRRWTDILTDGEALHSQLRRLPPPLPLFHEELLERAWSIALADGEGSDSELAVLEQIADQIGADPGDLATWRARWDANAAVLAEHKVAFAAILIHVDGTIDPPEAEQFRQLVARQPLPDARRQELLGLLDKAPSIDVVGEKLVALPRERRFEVLRTLAPLVAASEQEDIGRRYFLELAGKIAAPDGLAERLLTEHANA